MIPSINIIFDPKDHNNISLSLSIKITVQNKKYA